MYKWIYKQGVKRRNPLLPTAENFLQGTDKWSRAELEAYQLEKLKVLVSWAYKHSEHYRRKLDEANMHPIQLQTLADLQRIPPITKKTLIEENEAIHATANFKRLIYSETSGSTGSPLTFYRNLEWDARHRAAIHRGYSWYDIQPWDRNGYFWGYNLDVKKHWKLKIMDKLVNRFRIFSYEKKEILTFIKNLNRADYLEGYSSMIYYVARKIEQENIAINTNLKMIKGTSEKIFDAYQPTVKKVFGRKIISEYGAAETGIIAFECPEGNMHTTMENVIVEVIEGEIYVTNLFSHSFPIIRYALGDYVEVDTETKCACGREHTIVTSVMGRIGKEIIGHQETYPSLTFYYIFKNIVMDSGDAIRYQVLQHQKGHLEFRLEQHLSPSIRKQLEAEIVKYFAQDMKYDIREGVDFYRDGGKLKDFVSFVETV
ncbi:phenylacetate--CoA ligase family protein [Listeria booriae]|uniref:Phenylacetate--CoA ligase family protein n=1 Tax=Listeria booriae TaxID=1552123 RepID=A0A7X1CLF2_9LIST|nr:phenylacetate--CoA ligase family protein [Listeria booriae]MBC1793060.1 phenylacetate--CoA ligase family protein [Listeria booriae]MBC1800598.1 phenylacetate--CoA ligase family protein [Listeria booriae]MBC1803959.1 phenylacetate--CoA ligase family protein [Listeria booriae]MBC1812200.1 phenylacetate--CoA ligase family protein [Listeria booriae]